LDQKTKAALKSLAESHPRLKIVNDEIVFHTEIGQTEFRLKSTAGYESDPVLEAVATRLANSHNKYDADDGVRWYVQVRLHGISDWVEIEDPYNT
jgi:hypothetical protein